MKLPTFKDFGLLAVTNLLFVLAFTWYLQSLGTLLALWNAEAVVQYSMACVIVLTFMVLRSTMRKVGRKAYIKGGNVRILSPSRSEFEIISEEALPIYHQTVYVVVNPRGRKAFSWTKDVFTVRCSGTHFTDDLLELAVVSRPAAEELIKAVTMETMRNSLYAREAKLREHQAEEVAGLLED